MYDKSAVISECGQYRYELRRIWQPKTGAVCFVMLNPSTADADIDDPTIRRCMGFAATWGYGGIIVGNLFAYRATDPNFLKIIQDPVGPMNDEFLKVMSERADITICAWGDHGRYLNRGSAILRLLDVPNCLAINKSGSPKHPLYAKRYLTPKPFPPNKAMNADRKKRGGL